MLDRGRLGLVVAGLLTASLSRCNLHEAYPAPGRPADKVAMVRGGDFSAEAIRKHPGLINAGIDTGNSRRPLSAHRSVRQPGMSPPHSLRRSEGRGTPT